MMIIRVNVYPLTPYLSIIEWVPNVFIGDRFDPTLVSVRPMGPKCEP